MGLSEFHDNLSTIILHFGGDPGDRHRCGAIFLIRCAAALSHISPFDNRL
jgi:hypothetical protein